MRCGHIVESCSSELVQGSLAATISSKLKRTYGISARQITSAPRLILPWNFSKRPERRELKSGPHLAYSRCSFLSHSQVKITGVTIST